MNIFDSIKITKPKRNVFDKSHEKKLSCNMSDLVPIYLEEILPGDQFRVTSEVFMRLAPMVAPIMHRVNVFVHYFFVPNRLVYDEWENFITGGEDGTESPSFPKLNITTTFRAYFNKGTLADYFGIPVTEGISTINQNKTVSALPFRGYQMIFNEYYRDQNSVDKIEFSTGETHPTADYVPLTTIRQRAWEKDYFTSALPFAQKGDPVNLPIDAEFSPQYLDPALAETLTGPSGTENITRNSSEEIITGGEDTVIRNLEDPQVVDSTSVTINDLRTALRLQRWLERNARAGTRYVEQILGHFGVRLGDYRAQRPVYLGGGKQNVVISEVLASTAATGQPLATMAGHGISVGNQNKFTQKFTEHGFVFGLMSVIPRSAYQQGLAKYWRKYDKFDYFWPEFAQLGEQPVLNEELYLDYESTGAEGSETFGYQSRYAEYKFTNSSVHGDFRDDLLHWHMGRVFSSLPVLNESFISANPSDRVFAVDDDWATNKLYVQVFNKVRAIRPIPKFNTPHI